MDRWDVIRKEACYIVMRVRGPRRDKIKYSDITTRKELRKKRKKEGWGKLDNVFYDDLKYKQFEFYKQAAEQRLTDIKIPPEIVVRISNDWGYWVVVAERKTAKGDATIVHLPL